MVHHNAMLTAHRENGHKFSPDQVLENMNEQDVAKDEETPQSTPWSSAAL